ATFENASTRSVVAVYVPTTTYLARHHGPKSALAVPAASVASVSATGVTAPWITAAPTRADAVVNCENEMTSHQFVPPSKLVCRYKLSVVAAPEPNTKFACTSITGCAPAGSRSCQSGPT